MYIIIYYNAKSKFKVINIQACVAGGIFVREFWYFEREGREESRMPPEKWGGVQLS